MFKFNFHVEKDAASSSSDETDIEEEEVDLSIPCGMKSLAELSDTVTSSRFMKISLDDTSFLKCVDSYKTDLNSDKELSEINKTHDLVAGRYEGGLKIWELSVDLARFLFNVHTLANDHARSILSLLNASFLTNELRILELGCGHALPSLSVLASLHARLNQLAVQDRKLKVVIYLQDFNKQIIETITSENVREYLSDHESSFVNSNVSLEFKFVYGDWRRILDADLLPADYFNLILTSETIYNRANYHSLLKLFTRTMSKKSSMVLLAAKTYYFGCGGNSLEFVRLAQSKEYRFNCSPNLLDLSTTTTTTMGDDTTTIGKEIIKMERVISEVYA